MALGVALGSDRAVLRQVRQHRGETHAGLALEAAQAALPFTTPRLIAVVPNTVSPQRIQIVGGLPKLPGTCDAEDKLTGVRFSWKKRGNKKHAEWDNTVLGWIEIDGTRLIAEVNSEARADAIRKKIETALCEDVRYRAREIQSLEKLLADVPAAGGVSGGAASGERKQLAEHPEVRETISAIMAAHWEHWVDQPIPILGNRTPMEAVKSPDGREIVESIIIQSERDGHSPHMQTDEDVFRRLRERLGLARSRSTSSAIRHGRAFVRVTGEIFNAVLVLVVVTSLLGPVLTELFTPARPSFAG
jgi:hypothetical protein